MKFTPLILASLASLAIAAGPALNCEETSTNTPEQSEGSTEGVIEEDCSNKEENAYVNCKKILGNSHTKCLDESDAVFTECKAAKPNFPAIEAHCDRPGKDKDACIFAARRCTAQLNKDADMWQFLQCIDRMQVCADQGAKLQLDQCLDKAKDCQAREFFTLGELTKLDQCAKKNL
ncbi:hypothetical protein CRV24_009505 [Beauveria bassiana]|uniref:Uncharacterized protein n=1 Tax=Beauveria bassiana (strain ARSEF 2860) TaxID=655819 RepID=J4UHE6_BEAB2|nr:uncharacterized protein BBA_08508 [Beauveria bassiana ARSEF 2860]EJP62597.1 hypothetical protein BBA_08508 [Beauveria bassiana ARSEF 2860]KAF1730048.1 hypothetical protein CRV24_009505 [Beauveria bassiana]KAH8707773.1 hypothetical protein HC256_009944 [Beauveria bassiana]